VHGTSRQNVRPGQKKHQKKKNETEKTRKQVNGAPGQRFGKARGVHVTGEGGGQVESSENRH